MKENPIFNKEIDRRTFIKAVGIYMAAAFVSESSQSQNNEPKAPSGFPVSEIKGTTPVFSTGREKDMSIPQSEITDSVGPAVRRFPGSVDGIQNPPGMDNVLVGKEEAWKPVDEAGQVKDDYVGFK